jgi:hypothetical protein
MSSKRTLAAVVVVGALALGGCDTIRDRHIGDDDPGFGETVKYDQAIQTINPVPVYPVAAAQPGDNGAKGQAAVKRYRTDAVKQVQASQTTSGSAGGTGSGMSSGAQ